MTEPVFPHATRLTLLDAAPSMANPQQGLRKTGKITAILHSVAINSSPRAS